MDKFKIIRDLKPHHFAEHPVWSEYYDFEELEELRLWGVHEKYIQELLSIADEGGEHPYYTVPLDKPLPDRQRIHISTTFITPSGKKLKGAIINPNPFGISIFCGDEEKSFNPNLMDWWAEGEMVVKNYYSLKGGAIFPLTYVTNYRDKENNIIKGVYGDEQKR